MFIRDITGIRHVHDTILTWFSGTLKTCRETQPTQFTLKIVYLPELKHLNVMPSMLGILKTRKKKHLLKLIAKTQWPSTSEVLRDSSRNASRVACNALKTTK